MRWLSSAPSTARTGTAWRLAGAPRLRSDHSAPPEFAMGKESGNGRSLQEGLIVVDDMFRLIAADKGALSILSAETGAGPGSDGAPLPGRIAEFLKAAGSTKVPLRIGSQVYLCRTFDLRQAGAPGTAAPAAAIYVQRDVSIDDFIDAVAAECHLTERERSAVEGVVMGLSSKEIAAQMKIAPNTVKSFLRTVMIKMGVSTRAAIVRKVLQFDNQEHD